jgi:hypothetical protein
MTISYNHGKSEFLSSVEEYLSYALKGATDVSDYDSSRANIDEGNYLDLLKLITSKLCAANIISEQEILDTLGRKSEYYNPCFKAKEHE